MTISARQTWALYLAIALGSVIGSVARAAMGPIVDYFVGSAFPFGTLFVNVVGSFAIGFYAAFAEVTGRLTTRPLERHFVMTGFCGGYTTFSMFSLDTLRLAINGQWAATAGNIAGSLLCWLIAVWLGFVLAQRLFAKP